MLKLKAKKRDIKTKAKTLRKHGLLPGVLYGFQTNKAVCVVLDFKEFEKVFKEARESSLIELSLGKEKFLVLIHDFQTHPLTGEIIHADFYAPSLEKKVTAYVPLVFKGSAPAVSNLGGTLVKSLTEVEVKALPQELPHEIEVDVSVLDDFEKVIKIKDLKVSPGVKILGDREQVVCNVIPQEKIEEELEKPIEEDLSEVKVAEEKEEDLEGKES